MNPAELLHLPTKDAADVDAAGVEEEVDWMNVPVSTRDTMINLGPATLNLRKTQMRKSFQQLTPGKTASLEDATGIKERHFALPKAHVRTNFVKDVDGTVKAHIGTTALGAEQPATLSMLKKGTSTTSIRTNLTFIKIPPHL